MMNVRDSWTFADVMLEPKYSEISSRSDVDLGVKLCKGFSFSQPIVPANMSSVCGIDLAIEMYKRYSLALLHRFESFDEQLVWAKKVSERRFGFQYVGFSVGVKDIDYGCVDMLVEAGVRILCIDIAHCDSIGAVKMTSYISNKYPKVLLIAGNVATASGARRLWKAGADVVKVGIGSSGICTTRLEAAAGVPQLTALSDVWDMKKSFERELGRELYVMSDGGCVNHGDFTKALCFSHMVMTGHLFAGAVETPGEMIEIDGKRYKSYVGSSTHKVKHIEGVKALVDAKGSVVDILDKAHQAIKSGCSYQGAKNLDELKVDPRFVRLSNAGWRESGSHDVIVMKE